MSEYSGYYNERKFWLNITPRSFDEMTPGNMKFRIKNVMKENGSLTVLVDCESFMFKIKNPTSQECLVTQKLQDLKKGEEMEVELEFRNPEEDKYYLKDCYHRENAEGLISIVNVGIGSLHYDRNSRYFDDEVIERNYDVIKFNFEDGERQVFWPKMKEDTEESKKIKDIFNPIMLNKMRAETDGASVNQKALEKKNAKNKKKKKCCTIL
ncbi:hypothetical protein B9Z55_008241 [Caenorhabditis nigoni]|uniref:Uncharacterized protein n=3 Tax=Caenorhabditis nigoni TaxID=1611254 RepID=A0A2G5VDT1_9PELO|nr:hypothetical protein B9Z55_008241 [Caenorhabditis nigoni]